MRLLLTRAVEDAARTRALLEAGGHQVIVSPVITVVALAPAWPSAPFQGLVATSARAFSGLVANEGTRLLPLSLVGAQTLAAARASGFAGPRTVEPDALSLLSEMLEPRGRRLIYIAGTDRKPDLEKALAARGCDLTVLETYRAAAAPTLTLEAKAALIDRVLDGVLHYSRRSAEIFLGLSGGYDVDRLTHYCLSGDVARPLRDAGCRTVVAGAPTTTAMLDIITVGDALS